MKKALSTILAAVMLVGAVSGCAGGGATSSDVTTIEIWTGDASAKQTWTELINEYNKGEGKEKGIAIKFKFTTDNQTETDVAAQQGKLPDIVTPSFTQVEQFIKQGDIVALEDVAGLADFAANYKTPVIENQNYFDGKLYSVSSFTTTAGLLYNKDLFKAAGIVDENGEAKPPKTFDEMLDAAKKITDKEKGVYGYAFPLTFSAYYTLWCPMQNSFTKPMLKVDYDNLTYDYENYFKAFEYMLKMRDDGSLFPGSETLDNDTARAYFAEGLVGMMPSISWDVGVLTAQFVANCDWDVAPYPVYKEGQESPRYQEPGGNFYITKNGAEKGEKMAEAYKWLYSSDVITRFYETGAKIPSNPEMVKEGAVCAIPQAKSYMDLVDDNYKYEIMPKIAIDGDGYNDVFKKIWADATTLEEGLKDLNERATTAFRKAVDDGSVDVEYLKEVNNIK